MPNNNPLLLLSMDDARECCACCNASVLIATTLPGRERAFRSGVWKEKKKRKSLNNFFWWILRFWPNQKKMGTLKIIKMKYHDALLSKVHCCIYIYIFFFNIWLLWRMPAKKIEIHIKAFFAATVQWRLITTLTICFNTLTVFFF